MIDPPKSLKDCHYLMAEISAIDAIIEELPADNVIEINGFRHRKKSIESLIAHFESNN